MVEVVDELMVFVRRREGEEDGLPTPARLRYCPLKLPLDELLAVRRPVQLLLLRTAAPLSIPRVIPADADDGTGCVSGCIDTLRRCRRGLGTNTAREEAEILGLGDTEPPILFRLGLRFALPLPARALCGETPGS